MATKASRIALAGSNISSTGEVDADLLDNIDSAAFLSLDSNGRLGIGTSNPERPLHVKGANAFVRIESTSASQNSQLDIKSTAATWSIGQNQVLANTGTLEFYNGSSSPVVIKTNGNVGIGTTSPGEKLSVNGSVQVLGNNDANYSAKFISGYDSTHGLRITTRINSSTESEVLGVFANSGGGSPRLALNPSNGWNLGIGTANPTAKLHVSIPAIAAGTDLQKQGIVVTTPFTSGYQQQSSGLLSGYDGTLHGTAIGMAYEDPGYALTFFTNDNTSGLPIERMRINDNGTLSLNYGTNGGWEGATSIPTLTINQSDTHRGIALRTVGNSNVGPTFSLERTRASGAATQHADYVGNIRFNGTTGSYIGRVAAGIEAQQWGSVLAGYAPGRLKLMTAATTATHNGQNPATGSYAARMVINPGGDQLINGQFNYHVISGTSSPNVAFQYDFYRATYAHPIKITTAISHWNGGYMSYKEQWIWGFNTQMNSRVVDEYNGGNGSWTISFPTSNIVRVRMNGDATYNYGSGWFIKLEGNLRREYTTA